MRAIINNHAHLWLALSGGLIHLFCCGLPLALSMLSLTSVFGIRNTEWMHQGWLGRNELEIFVFSGLVLLITGLAQYIAYRINCRTDGHCHHKPCDSKKRLARAVFAAAICLYLFNSAVLLTLH